MTDASKTPAAQNGAWDAWCEEWETIKTDWTQVAMSPGSDETEMNFAWYTKEGEEASFVLSSGDQIQTKDTGWKRYYGDNVKYTDFSFYRYVD